MRKLTDKVIAAGIIPDQTVKLMQLWGIHDGTHEETRQHTQEQLLRMVEEIGALLEEKSEIPELRETELDIEKLFREEAELLQLKLWLNGVYVDAYMMVAVDRAGRFIFDRFRTKVPGFTQPGNRIIRKGKMYEIFGVETRYVADQPKWDVCTVQEVPDAKV